MMIILSSFGFKKVKVWCTNQESSVINIDMKANICSVKYNPGSSMYVAVSIFTLLCDSPNISHILSPFHIFFCYLYLFFNIRLVLRIITYIIMI